MKNIKEMNAEQKAIMYKEIVELIGSLKSKRHWFMESEMNDDGEMIYRDSDNEIDRMHVEVIDELIDLMNSL